MKLLKNIFRGSKIACSDNLADLYVGDNCKLLSRQIVLENLSNPLDNNCINENSSKHIHAVIVGTTALCYNILRQIALVSHYPNFNDEVGKNRTRITIVSPDTGNKAALEGALAEVKIVTGNLLQECCWSCSVLSEDGLEHVDGCEKRDSFIDIEVEIIALKGVSVGEYFKGLNDRNSIVSVFANMGELSETEKAFVEENFLQLYEIDEQALANRLESMPHYGDVAIRRARLCNMVYSQGVKLKDVHAVDLYNVRNYSSALSVFLGNATESKAEACWQEIANGRDAAYARELKLSNVMCADFFEVKLRGIGAMGQPEAKQTKLIAENLESLSKLEHVRWNVEKLIFGFRAYTAEERYNDGMLVGAARKERRKNLKEQHKAHINICSYKDLKRTDPDNLKYDSFLTLAMVDIIAKAGK